MKTLIVVSSVFLAAISVCAGVGKPGCERPKYRNPVIYADFHPGQDWAELD
ncbi:MAG: hypothetical protein IJ173_01820 [Kiritimatiellae bacterium]|nr:hypothetical protein [Kiritimatiellia bacterium]